jgi:hypothetical protein
MNLSSQFTCNINWGNHLSFRTKTQAAQKYEKTMRQWRTKLTIFFFNSAPIYQNKLTEYVNPGNILMNEYNKTTYNAYVIPVIEPI